MTSKTRRGFTLIELLVSLTLLALLASVAVPLNDLVKLRAREAELRQALTAIRSALDSYKRVYDAGHISPVIGASGYPPDLRVLVDGVTDIKSLNGDKIYFLRKLPSDPMCECSDTGPEQTWETRSYDSDADSFTSGKDVFDIRSTSTKEGIDGTPYRDW